MAKGVKDMPTCLITGGAGFIGSHLAETLLKHSHGVLALDDLSSGSVKNIAHLRSDPRFEFVPESVRAQNVLTELVDIADVIFHLAATVGVLNIIESPVTTIVNNISGTETVLKAAAKKKKKVIVASTSTGYAPRFPLEQALCLIHDWFVDEKIVEESAAFKYAAAP
jgi:UDP-glucose 4-epimerase